MSETIYGKLGGASAAANETAAHQPSTVATSEATSSPTVAGDASAATSDDGTWMRGGSLMCKHGDEAGKCNLCYAEKFAATSETPEWDAMMQSVSGGMFIDGSDGVTAEEDFYDKACRLGPDLERRLNVALRDKEKARAAYRASGRENTYEGGNLHYWWERAIKAQSELASVKADAERLDWLIDNCPSFVLIRGVVLPANTREAIDKARAAKGGKT